MHAPIAPVRGGRATLGLPHAGRRAARQTPLEDDVQAALRLAGEAAARANELPFTPVVSGVLGFGGLVALLLVTYAFRSVGTRH